MNDTEIIKTQTKCIAHEIRNHISICDMYTEIIRKNTERDNYQNPSVENAISCIKNSLRIISNTLLDLKSINSFTLKKYDFKTILETGTKLSEVYATGKEIKINSCIKNTGEIYIDSDKFIACIVNIIKNAIEAIESKGEINIIAEIKNREGHIKISNNGKMIPSNKQKEIFSEGYTTKNTGSGLGLFICKTNLESQNAELKLNKSTKTLTEFEIIIPITNNL